LCRIPASAYTASAPAVPPAAAETRPTTTTVATLSLAANSLVYNPFNLRFYASVGSSQGASGNSVAVIDPVTATITTSIFVGSEPTKLALSDDGQVLWVALDGAAAVRRIDLGTGVVGAPFFLGADPFYGLQSPRDLAALPGTHDSVIVTPKSKTSTAIGGPVIYDNGVPRDYTAANSLPEVTDLIPTYSPQLLFGYNNESTGFELTTLCMNAAGVIVAESTRVFDSFDLTFSFAQNVIYSGSGVAYDIATGSLRGTFAGRGAVAADASTRRVFFLNSNGQPTIAAYDMDTFLAAGSETLSAPSGSQADLVRWGRYGYAFRTDSKTVVIVRSSLVPDAP
jgi:DNA-binding beta-propeller fold protein YncE